ncbi:MAG: adenosine deaminase [Acidobacteriaceae bacterium]|nr:adenosine deaminase [Acidobacteriaceae bacterium]
MRKAELHVHLEGSVEPATLLEIDSTLSAAEIAAHMPKERTFAAFIESYVWVNRRLRSPQDYALAAKHLLERLAQQDVAYAEVTLSAGIILWKKQDLAAIYDAIWAESQASQVKTRWILDAVRQFGPDEAAPLAEFAVSRREHGVVAFGIGGYEDVGPAQWFREVFSFARQGGLRLVAHAGETVGPESIWAALEIGAERIGHGISAVEDAELMAHLRDRKIPLEVSISSNVCTGVVTTLRDHPVRRLYDAGVPLVLNTDDPALFFTSLDREYKIAEREFGIPPDEMAANSFRYAFDAAEREWASGL